MLWKNAIKLNYLKEKKPMQITTLSILRVNAEQKSHEETIQHIRNQ